jgi:hypothetical protein
MPPVSFLNKIFKQLLKCLKFNAMPFDKFMQTPKLITIFAIFIVHKKVVILSFKK